MSRRRTTHVVGVLGLAAIAASLFFGPRAVADASSSPALHVAAVNLVALTPKAVPVSPLSPRGTIGVQNRCGASVWLCGAAAGCSDTTGWEVLTGTFQSYDLSYGTDASGKVIGAVYLYSVGGCASPTNVRVMEVR